MAKRETVVIGAVGSNLDAPRARDRWRRWRPSVSVCQQDEFSVDRYELMCQAGHRKLAERLQRDIVEISPQTEVLIHEVNYEDPWDFVEVYGTLHDFAQQYVFDPEAEDYFVHITTGTHVMQICLFLLTESHYFPGTLLQSSPAPHAEDELPKGMIRKIDLDLSKYDRLHERFRKEQEEGIAFLKRGIPTMNPGFNGLMEQIEQVALRSSEPMLLTGPTGAGKTHLARRIFELKKSRSLVAGPFVEVNCATLRGDSAMSMLFGHRKGSFTGAVKDRSGLLAAADGGILFLDEIGELGLDEQAMLLRAVEEKQFFPLGMDTPVFSHFLLIAGTNRDLREAVATGQFREDLLARIHLWNFRLPGLRERREDIEPNIDFELAKYAETNDSKIRFNKSARQRFVEFATGPEGVWPGNFRDLSGAIVRMATLSPSGRVSDAGVEEEIGRLREQWGGPASEKNGDEIARLSEWLTDAEISEIDDFDLHQLEYVIGVCQGSESLSDAGRRLFAHSRAKKKNPNDADRVRKYLKRFGLAWPLNAS